MRSKVQRWGSSLAVRIPRAVALEVGLRQDSAVDLAVVEGEVRIAPASTFRLEDLLAGVTDDNVHPEVSTGPPAGKEVW